MQHVWLTTHWSLRQYPAPCCPSELPVGKRLCKSRSVEQVCGNSMHSAFRACVATYVHMPHHAHACTFGRLGSEEVHSGPMPTQRLRNKMPTACVVMHVLGLSFGHSYRRGARSAHILWCGQATWHSHAYPHDERHCCDNRELWCCCVHRLIRPWR